MRGWAMEWWAPSECIGRIQIIEGSLGLLMVGFQLLLVQKPSFSHLKKKKKRVWWDLSRLIDDSVKQNTTKSFNYDFDCSDVILRLKKKHTGESAFPSMPHLTILKVVFVLFNPK